MSNGYTRRGITKDEDPRSDALDWWSGAGPQDSAMIRELDSSVSVRSCSSCGSLAHPGWVGDLELLYSPWPSLDSAASRLSHFEAVINWSGRGGPLVVVVPVRANITKLVTAKGKKTSVTGIHCTYCRVVHSKAGAYILL